VQKNLAGSDLLNMNFPIPPREEQDKIVEIVKSHDQKIMDEEQYKARLQRFKKGLMQDLLTGRVRSTGTNIDVLDEVQAHG
jgi:type I restriction enzyme S subunit